MTTTSVCGMPVLISGYDDYFRVALRTILTDRLGVSVVLEATSFEEAVECLSSHPELALTIFAIDMPGMSNWVDLRTVRDLFPDLRVAVVSASKERHDILMSLQSGVHGYVSKTVSVNELTVALRHICNGHVYIPSFFPELPVAECFDGHIALAKAGRSGGRFPRVTARQKEIIELLVAGKSNKAMARALDLSEGTVKFHLSAAFRLLGATNRVEAATAGTLLLNEVQASGAQL
ncbi:MAG: response regulator transcription factor [Gemmobacter sp.]|nr:response regulator transcription factor [Gemmobacter sp.]